METRWQYSWQKSERRALRFNRFNWSWAPAVVRRLSLHRDSPRLPLAPSVAGSPRGAFAVLRGHFLSVSMWVGTLGGWDNAAAPDPRSGAWVLGGAPPPHLPFSPHRPTPGRDWARGTSRRVGAGGPPAGGNSCLLSSSFSPSSSKELLSLGAQKARAHGSGNDHHPHA